jgi:hypothetical protein
LKDDWGTFANRPAGGGRHPGIGCTAATDIEIKALRKRTREKPTTNIIAAFTAHATELTFPTAPVFQVIRKRAFTFIQAEEMKRFTAHTAVDHLKQTKLHNVLKSLADSLVLQSRWHTNNKSNECMQVWT